MNDILNRIQFHIEYCILCSVQTVQHGNAKMKVNSVLSKLIPCRGLNEVLSRGLGRVPVGILEAISRVLH